MPSEHGAIRSIVPMSEQLGFGSDGMATMDRKADDSPPPYFGDYPNGAYWSAFDAEGSVEDDAERGGFHRRGHQASNHVGRRGWALVGRRGFAP